MQIALGQQIDHYHIDALLGEGSMGAVYQAYDLNLTRKVALKVMHSQLAKEPHIQDRFLQQAQAVTRLVHPSVVRIYSFDSNADFQYLVMEYVSGPSLSVYLRLKQEQNEPVGLDKLLRLLAQVADALEYSHGQGIVHRGIKPDNILLKPLTEPDREGDPLLRVMVTDFGLAKLLEGGFHTQTGAFMGTLAYMSPEQCLGQSLDGRSDIYSLGIVTYQVVTGMLPFNVQSPTEAVHKHAYEAPVSPGQINPGMPNSVEQIIMRSLAKDPAGRFQSGKQLATALRRASGSMSTTDLTRWELSGVAAIAATQLLAEDPAGTLPSQFGETATDSEVKHDQLRLMRKGETPITIDMDQSVITIGRSKENNIVLDYKAVSRRHAQLERIGNGWNIVDLKSVNGTFLNEARLLPDLPQSWEPGSLLQIGAYFFQWRKAPSNGLAAISVAATASSIDPTAAGATSATTIGNLTLIAVPDHIELEAGAAGYIQLSMLNSGNLVDHFRIRVNNLSSEWVQLSEEQVELMPGARTFIRLTIQPPRDSSALAGEYLFQIVAMPLSDPLNASRFGARLDLKPFEAFTAEMRPQRIQHGGLTRVLVKNIGNAEGVFGFSGRDPAAAIRFKGSDSPLTVSPGDQATRNIRLYSSKRPIAGRVTSRLFTLQVRSTSGQRQSISGRLDVPPILSTRLFFILGLLALLVCIVAAALTVLLALDQLPF